MAAYVGFDSSTQGLAVTVIMIDGWRREVLFEDALRFDDNLPEYGTRHGVLPAGDPRIVHAPPLMWAEALDLMMARIARSGLPLQQIAGIFQGPLNWIYVVLLIAAVVVGIAGVYAAWQFALSTELRPLFYWGAGAAFCLVVLAVVRILFFMQLNTNRVLRELKRLELQVALLAARTNG